jgi:hypothetical protein
MKTDKVLMILSYLAIFFKISFILFAVLYRISEKKNITNNLLVWKTRIDVFYVVTMSIFLIFIFSPRSDNKRYLTKTICNLLFLYGIISIVTADWGSFK